MKTNRKKTRTTAKKPELFERVKPSALVVGAEYLICTQCLRTPSARAA